MANIGEHANPDRDLENQDAIGQEILKAVAGIQYGSVEVLIHDSRVVQIEAREKIRFNEAPKKKL